MPPVLYPGPITLIVSGIPFLGFLAPACMYVDQALFSMTGYMASEEHPVLEGVCGEGGAVATIGAAIAGAGGTGIRAVFESMAVIIMELIGLIGD